MNIVFLGCPGSGKSTQAKALAGKLGMVHFSTGNIFWDEIQRKTPLGHELMDSVTAGRLVPDWLVMDVLKDKLGAEKRGILFDGFPRSTEQAEGLDSWLSGRSSKLDAVIYFHMPETAALQRLERRVVCSSCGAIAEAAGAAACTVCGGPVSSRGCDKPEILKRRLMAYKDQTEPVLSYYRSNDILVEVKADKPQQDVTVQIALALKSLVQ